MSRHRRLRSPIASLAAAMVLLAAPAADAQGIRISGVTSMQYVELRQLVVDSALQSAVPGTGEIRATADGVPALCPTTSAYCTFERSGSRLSTAPLLQDVTVTGWGLAEGLSFHATLRARTEVGSSALAWPSSDRHFSLLDGYAELERGEWRGRLGRQWTSGGLGVYDYDGGDLFWRRDAWSAEGFAGRALLAGGTETYTSGQLAAIENIPPDQDGYIVGMRARYRPDALTAASVLYQRVLVADHSGLYSERAAVDASLWRFGAQWDLGGAYDLATGAWNDARLRATLGGFTSGVRTSVELHHSRPFFDLWTIWGAFSPVGYDEARVTLDWRSRSLPLSLSVHGAFREHEASDAPLVTLRRDGWRAGWGAQWTPSDALSVNASYDVDIASGAASEDARAGVRWSRPSGLSLGADATVTQNIYEFRVGTGRIYGAVLSAMLPLRDDLSLVADGGWYQHALTNGAAGPDWTQHRASLRLEWTAGRDPGRGARADAMKGGTP